MRWLAFASVLGVVGLSIASAMPAVHAQQASVDSVVQSVSGYVERLQQQITGVVIEEDYLQQAQGPGVTVRAASRRLRSDLTIMADTDFDWVEFRDIFEVDGKPVRDRQARVVELFASTVDARAFEHAKRLVEEGARYNLSAVGIRFQRTVNLPLGALRFLQQANRSRSSFSVAGSTTLDGRRATILRFTETETPRLIPTPDNAPAQGRLWIDDATGAVMRSELQYRSGHGMVSLIASVRVQFEEHPQMQLWLPSVMEEEYRFIDSSSRGSNTTVHGRASYSNIRQFRVGVQEQFVE